MNRQAYAAAVLVLSLGAGGAIAQTPPVVPAAAPAHGPVRGEVLSDSEKQSRASDHLETMRKVLKAVLNRLEEARGAKDVVKLNCVNDKLTNIKGLLRISEQAHVALQEAIAKREEQASDHEYAKIAIAFQKTEQLRGEAEQCVGLLAFETGPTEVEVEEPTDLAKVSPNKPPDTLLTRAPPVSPSG